MNMVTNLERRNDELKAIFFATAKDAKTRKKIIKLLLNLRKDDYQEYQPDGFWRDLLELSGVNVFSDNEETIEFLEGEFRKVGIIE